MRESSDYISQMVQDTFDSLDESNVLPFSSEKVHCSRQLEMDFDAYHIQYDSDRLCLILTLNGQQLEIPVNWGPFQWCDFNSLNADFSLLLENYQDTDHLLDILGTALGFEAQSLHIKFDGNDLKILFHSSEHGSAENQEKAA